MNCTISKCTISDLENAPNIAMLLEEYAGESAIDGLPHPSAKAEIYKQIEATGILQAISAHLDNILIGFVVVLTSVLPHYGRSISTTESLFVAKAYRRNTNAGIGLIRAAENHAKSLNSPGFLISAPVGGQLASLLAIDDYSETNRVFFKRFADE